MEKSCLFSRQCGKCAVGYVWKHFLSECGFSAARILAPSLQKLFCNGMTVSWVKCATSLQIWKDVSGHRAHVAHWVLVMVLRCCQCQEITWTTDDLSAIVELVWSRIMQQKHPWADCLERGTSQMLWTLGANTDSWWCWHSELTSLRTVFTRRRRIRVLNSTPTPTRDAVFLFARTDEHFSPCAHVCCKIHQAHDVFVEVPGLSALEQCHAGCS